MKSLSLAVAFASLLFAGEAYGGSVILRDDFNGTSINRQLWSLGTWTLGRTQLGNNPIVANGIARLTFDKYRFRGTEIFTNRVFSRGTGLEIEARAKLNNLPSGLVTSLFTYTYDGTTKTSDEIDIEIVTKQVNQTFNGAPIYFTSWNDWNESSPTYQDGVHNWTIRQVMPAFDVNQWHSYVIRWLPDHVEWLIDGKIVATTSNALPDAAAPVRLNFWAPASSWSDAYDSRLQSVNQASKNVRYYYDVDYVEVRSLP